MRTRVASIVTLFTLFLLGFLLFQTCSVQAGDINDAARRDLETASNMIGAALAGEDCGGRIGLLKPAAGAEGTLAISLHDADGKVIFSDDGSVTPLSEAAFAAGTAGRGVYEDRDADGNAVYCAVTRFEDGAFLRISALRRSWGSILFSARLLPLVIAICLALLIYLFIVLAGANRKEKLAGQVMAKLDEFTEGRFDKRIEPLEGDSGDVERYNAIIERIQQRVIKQASRNNALNVIMDQMQNGIIAVDEELRVILVTPVAKKLLGIIGNPDGKHINDASNDVRLDELFTEAMKQGGVYTNEVAARTAAGRTHRPLRLYVSLMHNEGHVVGAMAMVEDITEIRKLERVRTDFAANVSHELKTPLTSIRGFVETLEAGAIDNPPMAHKFLKIIMMETERLTRLINDILSISKLESGDDEVTVERLRLDKMAYDVADMLSIHAGEKDVTVNCHMNDAPVYIMGNSDRVEQMLINLVENAIKYNRPGGSVTVQVFSNGVNANLDITDTGIGIAEENLPRLFERFYRVDKGRSRQMGGTGLGLAIVKHIVRSMKGEIEVHSKENEGTEFLITLPLVSAGDPEKDTIFNDDK